MSYKKRGRKGWVGKHTAKERSKGRERMYAKAEIKQALEEEYQGEEFRYHINNRKKSEEKKLEGRVKSLESRIWWWRRLSKSYTDSFYSKHLNWLKSWLKETKEKLQTIKKKKI